MPPDGWESEIVKRYLAWDPHGRQDTKALSPDKPAHCKALPSKCQQARLQQMGHGLLLGRSSAVFRLRFCPARPARPASLFFSTDVFLLSQASQPAIQPSPYNHHPALDTFCPCFPRSAQGNSRDAAYQPSCITLQNSKEKNRRCPPVHRARYKLSVHT